jgi:hypothetical protein
VPCFFVDVEIFTLKAPFCEAKSAGLPLQISPLKKQNDLCDRSASLFYYVNYFSHQRKFLYYELS